MEGNDREGLTRPEAFVQSKRHTSLELQRIDRIRDGDARIDWQLDVPRQEAERRCEEANQRVLEQIPHFAQVRNVHLLEQFLVLPPHATHTHTYIYT